MLSTDVRTLLRGAVAAALAVSVCACGGGGGGSPNPVLGQLSFKTNENVALNGTVTATDPGGGAVSFTQQGSPTSGTLTGFTSSGGFTYTPNANFTGNDSFGVQVSDAAGHVTSGTVAITVTTNTPPTASNTAQRADGPALANINVLQAANDPDKDPLTLTILQQPPSGAGQVAVNTDGTVKITGLASGFKGVTSFTYQVKDPSGATAKANAAIFVGTDPFRAAFVGDAPANGSNEVYLTDFAAAPVAMTAATQGNLRLKAFAVSDNGATIVYRVQDTSSASNTSLAFVKTASPTQSTPIVLPAGTVPIGDGNGQDQFVVSPDGQWIAIVAGQGSLSSLYVVNVSQSTTVSQIQPTGAASVSELAFTLDSKSIYFLTDASSPGVHRSLYFASLSSPGTTTLMSDVSDDQSTSDDISAFAVSPDQSRIAVDAIRGGKRGVYFIDTRHPGAMSALNTVTIGRSVTASTIGLPAGRGGSTTVARVAYVEQGLAPGVYVADVSATPGPRLLVSPGLGGTLQILGLRPDDAALLYATSPNTAQQQVLEAMVADQPNPQAVGSGSNAWYDSTGNIVLLYQSPQALLVATSRGSFGTTSPVGTTSLAIAYNDVSGFDRGVAIIGQGPTSGPAPTASTLQLVNALAPQGLFPLASFQSPLPSQLTSYSSKVVSK